MYDIVGTRWQIFSFDNTNDVQVIGRIIKSEDSILSYCCLIHNAMIVADIAMECNGAFMCIAKEQKAIYEGQDCILFGFAFERSSDKAKFVETMGRDFLN